MDTGLGKHEYYIRVEPKNWEYAEGTSQQTTTGWSKVGPWEIRNCGLANKVYNREEWKAAVLVAKTPDDLYQQEDDKEEEEDNN